MVLHKLILQQLIVHPQFCALNSIVYPQFCALNIILQGNVDIYILLK